MASPDISKLSNEDLRAIESGDMSAVSDYGLKVLSGEVAVSPAPTLTPEQIAEHAKRTFKSSARAESPILSKAVDFLGGATSMLRGGINLVSPKTAEALFPEGGMDKESLTYLGGQVADPYAMATGLKAFQAAKAAAPALPALAQGMLGGALGGGVIGGVQSNDIQGAATGAALGSAIPVVGQFAKGLYNLAAPSISKKAAERGAARQLVEIADKDAAKLAEQLTLGESAKFSPLETMAQVAAPLENPKVAALQKYWAGKFGSVADYRNRTAQEALEKARIEFLGAETAPQRQAAIDKANEITRAFRVAEAKGASYADDAAAQVDKVRRMEALGQDVGMQQRADAMAQNGSLESGLPRVGGQAGSRAVELMDVGQRQATEAAQKSLVSGASARLADNIVGSMESRGLKPISASEFVSAITSVKNAPENITNDSMRLISQKIINAVARAAQANNGVLDAKSLDTLRRTAINDYIESATRGNPSQAKKLASHEVTSSIKSMIDDAIEKAGGKGYKDYMKTYSDARAKIEAPLERLGQSDEMASKGMQEIVEILNSEKIHGTGVLERGVTIAQAVARGLKGMAGTKVGKAGAELTQPENTQRLGMLMSEYMNAPRNKISPYIVGGSMNVGFGKRDQQ